MPRSPNEIIWYGSILLLPLFIHLRGEAGNLIIDSERHGFSMRLQMDNRGVFGIQANPPFDSLGMDYPLLGNIEHIWGGGLWVGGLLDTSNAGSGPPLKLVSTSYEGWAGPLYEFYPDSMPGDTVWRSSRGLPEPSGWADYWGQSIPYNPISDSDFNCRYTDYLTPVPQHIPLRLQVVESLFAWDDPYGEAIDILEYKIVNKGVKSIDSAYAGFLMDADVGPIYAPSYFLHNYAGYYQDLRTAYVHNPMDFGSTPVGVALIGASKPLDSLRQTFVWFPVTPSPDGLRYNVMSSGVIAPDQYPELSDTRFLLSVGPFDLQPVTEPDHDTLVIAFAFLSGQSLAAMRIHSERASEIYSNRGLPSSVTGVSGEIPEEFVLHQNYPNPFNPSTRIEYALPRDAFVRLEIYSVLGERVMVLSEGPQEAGYHSVVFEAEGLTSGIYFYRLQAGAFVDTKKLILMK